MASVVTQWGDSVNVPDTALDLNHSDGFEEEERGTPRQGSGGYLRPLVQFSSVAQSCLTLCTPGLPVHHQLPELTQTRVH